MVGVTGTLIAYLFGGVTFVPLIVTVAFCYAYFVLPKRQEVSSKTQGAQNTETDRTYADLSPLGVKDLPDHLKPRSHEPDVAAGYFAVCREYVPGGVNGKPPERTTPAGTVIAAESPSVYQSMYRSLFERGKTQGPLIEANKAAYKVARKARNVFYVVLR